MEQLVLMVIVFYTIIAISLVCLGIAIAKFGLIALVYGLAILGVVTVLKMIFG